MLLLPSQRQALVNELVDFVRDVASMDSTPEKYKENWAAEKPEDFPRIVHPLTVKQRIHTQTVHVQRKYDPKIRHTALAAKLCDKKRSIIMTLGGGPSGPSTFSDHRAAVAKAIEWVMKNSLQTGHSYCFSIIFRSSIGLKRTGFGPVCLLHLHAAWRHGISREI